MKYIISGTNRPQSRSLQIAQLIKTLYDEMKEPAEILDLCEVPLTLVDGSHYGDKVPPELSATIDKVNKAEGLIVVVPEYNGSVPGALKYFIDHWSYPESFEFRPVCFVGLGGRFGGLRPVEHLQQVFGYRNSFVYPERVFLVNIWSLLKSGKLDDEALMTLLRSQALGFTRFVKALQAAGLDANSRRSK